MPGFSDEWTGMKSTNNVFSFSPLMQSLVKYFSPQLKDQHRYGQQCR